jgi:hypothetical protein
MIYMKKLIISCFIFISVISYSFSQGVNVTASFDTSRIFIGDQLKFTVTVDKPSGLNLNIQHFKDTIWKNIEIVSGPFVDSLTASGRVKIVQKYLVTTFDSGFYMVPPVYAEMKSASGLKRFYSEYSVLEVIRVKTAPQDTTAKIFDIIKPYRAPLTLGEIFPWLLLTLLIAITVWAAIRYLRKLKNSREGVEIVVDPDPAHIIAFHQLEKLKEEKLWQKGELKKYYTRLTEILRQYLENRYRVYSLELTTTETLDELVKRGFRKDASYNQLKSILTGADLVKFAKYIPEPSENDLRFQQSWDFILATKEEEVEVGKIDEKVTSKEESL